VERLKDDPVHSIVLETPLSWLNFARAHKNEHNPALRVRGECRLLHKHELEPFDRRIFVFGNDR